MEQKEKRAAAEENKVFFPKESKWELLPREFHENWGPLTNKYVGRLLEEKIIHPTKPLTAYIGWQRKASASIPIEFRLEKNGKEIRWNKNYGFLKYNFTKTELNEFKEAIKSAIYLHPKKEKLLKLYYEMIGN
ncbi:MAG: hypothetical protein ACP5O3_03620 [Candidatus Micrarchaeia archaeon]|jgi:hypothetical protein